MTDRKTYCLDSNIFLALPVPAATVAPLQEIKNAETILRLLHKGAIKCVTSAIAFAEIRWVLLREGLDTYDMVEATLRQTLHRSLTIIDIDSQIASQSAFFRWKYYSKKNAFSYNDGLFLATALQSEAAAMITTDPHLIRIDEIPAMTPSAFMLKNVPHLTAPP